MEGLGLTGGTLVDCLGRCAMTLNRRVKVNFVLILGPLARFLTTEEGYLSFDGSRRVALVSAPCAVQTLSVSKSRSVFHLYPW